MFALRPRNDFVQLYMVFRRPPIRLAAASSECVLYNKSWNARPDAARSTVFVPDSHGEFIDQFGRDNLAVCEENMVLAIPRVGAGLRKIESADAVIST